MRVVIADNDPDILDLLVADLRAEGHDIVATATGGDEAVEVCTELVPDVLITDYRMPPGPNGLAVARELRARRPEMRVVLYTNYRQADIRGEAEALGVHFLLKGNIRALRRAVLGDRSGR
jgi:CheY-like chemotaxis protein